LIDSINCKTCFAQVPLPLEHYDIALAEGLSQIESCVTREQLLGHERPLHHLGLLEGFADINLIVGVRVITQ
jgi:hypothetical protein